jgi:hypothetical protein
MSASGMLGERRQHEIELWALLETITELEGELAQLRALQRLRSREEWAAARRGELGPAAHARAQQDEWACALPDDEFADLLGAKDRDDRPSVLVARSAAQPPAFAPLARVGLRRRPISAGLPGAR